MHLIYRSAHRFLAAFSAEYRVNSIPADYRSGQGRGESSVSVRTAGRQPVTGRPFSADGRPAGVALGPGRTKAAAS